MLVQTSIILILDPKKKWNDPLHVRTIFSPAKLMHALAATADMRWQSQWHNVLYAIVNYCCHGQVFLAAQGLLRRTLLAAIIFNNDIENDLTTDENINNSEICHYWRPNIFTARQAATIVNDDSNTYTLLLDRFGARY